jgi:hypothetical protein
MRSHQTDLQRASGLARREFSHAHMSDTKWRRLFAALGEADLNLRQMVVKFVGVRDARVMAFPSTTALHPPRPYIDTGEFGPIELRAIEWLEVPAIARLARPRKWSNTWIRSSRRWHRSVVILSRGRLTPFASSATADDPLRVRRWRTTKAPSYAGRPIR